MDDAEKTAAEQQARLVIAKVIEDREEIEKHLGQCGNHGTGEHALTHFIEMLKTTMTQHQHEVLMELWLEELEKQHSMN
jgi:hypothetical protein